jgi:hypothetical protein
MEKSICSFTPHPWCSRPHLITLKDNFNRDFTRDYVNKVWVHVALAMHIKGSHSKPILENACGLKLVLSQVPTKQELVLRLVLPHVLSMQLLLQGIVSSHTSMVSSLIPRPILVYILRFHFVMHCGFCFQFPKYKP